jgi:hypothetical protein
MQGLESNWESSPLSLCLAVQRRRGSGSAQRSQNEVVSFSSLPTDAVPVTAHLALSIAIVCPVPRPMTISDSGLPSAAPPPSSFFDPLETLPHWQQSFLAHLDSAQVAERLKKLLESGDKLQLCCLVSDLGSFGWELQLLAEPLCGPAWDQAFGLKPGSFQTESRGTLSAMIFLCHCFRFFNAQVSDNVDQSFCCDNQGLLKRIMTHSWDTPNCCLASE